MEEGLTSLNERASGLCLIRHFPVIVLDRQETNWYLTTRREREFISERRLIKV